MSLSSVLLLPSSNGQYNVTGEALRADGYWGSNSTTHTVAIHLHKFTGRIYLEASLAEDPAEADWFPIHLGKTTAYAEHRDRTAVDAFTFKANVSWLRARVERTYLARAVPTDHEIISQFGVVTQILLNH